MRHFTWGVAAGSGIDVTSHDMSTINIDAFFGYKGGAIDVAGIGAGIDVNISNSGRFFPVYAIFRTSFRRYASSTSAAAWPSTTCRTTTTRLPPTSIPA